MKTVNHWEFHRERRHIEIEINKLFNGSEKIWFIDTSDDEHISMGLNICATGSISVADAEVFAKALERAVQFAKEFKYNDYIKTYED